MKHLDVFTATLMIFGITSFVSCSKDDDDIRVPVLGIQLANNATLGTFLTDSAGNTLYFFSNDNKGTSVCNGPCVTAWPVFNKENPTLASGLVNTDFGSITRNDGSKQTTYKGWPLYYYNLDTKPGDVNGEGVNGVWYVAKPDYTVMIAKGQLVGNDSVEYNSQYQPGTESVPYLTDEVGRTLYAFTPDSFNINNYTRPDFSNNDFWPIYERAEIANVPSTLTKTDFGVIDVFGRKQVTFKGWPLYYFGPDAQTRGNTKGVSVPAPGVWPIVNSSTLVAPQ